MCLQSSLVRQNADWVCAESHFQTRGEIISREMILYLSCNQALWTGKIRIVNWVVNGTQLHLCWQQFIPKRGGEIDWLCSKTEQSQFRNSEIDLFFFQNLSHVTCKQVRNGSVNVISNFRINTFSSMYCKMCSGFVITQSLSHPNAIVKSEIQTHWIKREGISFSGWNILV